MRKHKVGDRVRLQNWQGDFDPHHPECKGTVTALRTDLSELDKRHHGTDYYATVEWDNGRVNTFYKPQKHLQIIDNFQIQEDLFEI